MRHLSFTTAADFLRERDFGQKIEATFDFMRVHARPLGRVMVALVLPLALLTGIGMGLLQGEMFSFIGQSTRARLSGAVYNSFLPPFLTSAGFWMAMLGSLLLMVVLHLVVYGYVVLRADRTDPTADVTIRDVWDLVRRRALGLVGSFFGLGLLFTVGLLAVGMVVGMLGALFGGLLGAAWLGILFVFLIYAAMIYAGVALSLYVIIWLREGRGFFGSIGRCFQLIWGKWWSTFGLIMVMSFILMLVVFFIMTLLSLFGLPFTELMTGRAEQTGAVRVLLILYTSLQSLASLVTYPLLMIAISFQYFNLVERRDGEGTYRLLNSLGQPAPAAPTPLALRPDDEGEY